MSIEAYDNAISLLHDILGQYDEINIDLIRLTDAWRQLSFNERIEFGKTYPLMTDALLKIENHVN